MQTQQKPSDLINQAITNLFGVADSELILKLWECMKAASTIEIKQEIKDQANGPAGAWCEDFLKHTQHSKKYFGFGCSFMTVDELKKAAGMDTDNFRKGIKERETIAELASLYLFENALKFNGNMDEHFERVYLFALDSLEPGTDNKTVNKLYYDLCSFMGYKSTPKPLELSITAAPYKRTVKFWPKVGTTDTPPTDILTRPRYGKTFATNNFINDMKIGQSILKTFSDLGKSFVEQPLDIKPKPTLRVLVTAGNGAEWKWYNEFVKTEIIADYISADGKAYFKNIGPKQNHAPGYIPKGSFKIVTEGCRSLTVKVIKKQYLSLWYNVGAIHRVKPMPTKGRFLIIDDYKYAFQILETDCIITGAEYGK